MDWVADRLAMGVCETSGLPFHYGDSDSHVHPLRPSLDKVIPSLGYTPENTRLTCYIYNHAKSDHGEELLLMLARALVDRYGEA